MQNWKDLYIELAEKVSQIPGIEWVDLWHNQVNFLEDEHPFPTPAVFLSFRTMIVEDARENMQIMRLQVEAYLFYETFADTYKGSVNQGSALDFLDLMNSIYAKLHGTTGENYSEMRRTGFNPVDTGSAGNLYQITFECNAVDLAAKPVYEEAGILDMKVLKELPPEPEPEPSEPWFIPG